MKNSKFRSFILGIFMLSLPLGIFAQKQDVTANPGYLDLEQLVTENENYITSEVYLQNYILKMIAKVAKNSEPEFAEMLSSIHLIRVMEFEFDRKGDNSSKAHANRLIRKIQSDNWDTLVRSRDEHSNVNISIKSDGESRIHALAVISWEESEMVVVNIVGDIDLEMLSRLGEQFDIDSLEDIETDAEDDA